MDIDDSSSIYLRHNQHHQHRTPVIPHFKHGVCSKTLLTKFDDNYSIYDSHIGQNKNYRYENINNYSLKGRLPRGDNLDFDEKYKRPIVCSKYYIGDFMNNKNSYLDKKEAHNSHNCIHECNLHFGNLYLSQNKSRPKSKLNRYSESEKDIYMDLVNVKICSRSESEPNDIYQMKNWNQSKHLKYQSQNLPKENKTNISSSKLEIQENFESENLNKVENQIKNPHEQVKKQTKIVPNVHYPRLNIGKKYQNKLSQCKNQKPIRKPIRTISKSIFDKIELEASKLEDLIQNDNDPIQEFQGKNVCLEEEDFSEDSSDESLISDTDNDYEKNEKDSKKELLSISQKISSNNLTSPFIASLFPYVPPYITFSTHSEKGPVMPEEIQKILQWKITSIMPKVLRRIVTNSGFLLVQKPSDWMGVWGKHLKSPYFRAMRSHQKINHIPGSFQIGRKDSCWKNLQIQISKHGKKEFGFMPLTYLLPQDTNILRKMWPKYAQKNFKWIIKPPASARGRGIKIINRWYQIPKRRSIIVQKYIERPLLINGSKFDLRLYVLVTSVNPLRVYMYKDGLVRFASVKYSQKVETFNEKCMHLTNYSINKLSSNYTRNNDANACQGHKWTLNSLWLYFSERGINTKRLWNILRNLVLKTIIAGENSIYNMTKFNMESKYNCYELFGFDFLLDAELTPWLLEVNISPSMHSELPLDVHVKGPLIQAILNTALYQVPPKLSPEKTKRILRENKLNGPLCFDKRLYITYLSREERCKHNQFTRADCKERKDYLDSILDYLTPDDVRCLIIAEDEIARSQPLERICPSANTFKYLKYTEKPRYYNRLLDAWENRYENNRSAGIKYLQELCEKKIHLEVPTAPVKKDSSVKVQENSAFPNNEISTIPKTDEEKKSNSITVNVNKGETLERIKLFNVGTILTRYYEMQCIETK